MRVYQLVRELAQHNSVSLLTYGPTDPPPSLPRVDLPVKEVRTVPRRELSGSRRRFRQALSLLSLQPFHGHQLHSRQMQAALDELLAAEEFDIVQVEASPMMCFRFRTAAALVIDEHNIESELLARQHDGERSAARRFFNGLEAHKYRRLENRAWARAAACVVTSAREAPQVTGRAPGTRTAVVPNGVDPSYFVPAPLGDQVPGRIVFTGLLSYRPNLDGAQWFIEEVLPRVRARVPGTTLTVVGAGTEAELARLTADGVTVTGLVPDVRPHAAAASCVVAPIRIGGGTRLKVVEALAMGKALVSTTVGCEGIEVDDGTHLLVADDAESFAAAVCACLEDPALRERLGAAARRVAVDKYAWDRSAARLRVLYDEVVRVEGGDQTR